MKTSKGAGDVNHCGDYEVRAGLRADCGCRCGGECGGTDRTCAMGSCGGRGRHKAYARVGEAKNPGPSTVGAGLGARTDWHLHPGQKEADMRLEYAAPGKTGFWGTSLPGQGVHEAAGDDGGEERYSLVVDSCNATSAGSLYRFLRRTCADLVLCQEHHLPPKDIAAASTRLRGMGWQSVWAHAVPGKGGGWSAGVAVIARAPIMISLPPKGSDKVHDGRAVAAKVEAPGMRDFIAYSLYLRDGEGLSEENLAILGDVGEHIEAHAGMPHLLGADFQCPPAALARAGFAENVGAMIMATGHPRGTCRMKNTSTEI